MLWIEAKYACLLSSRVRNYKRKSSNLWNFSCPICGDSEKNKKRARGYLYENKGKLRFHCHKCAADQPFDKFIREIDESLYSDMKKEQLLDYKEAHKPEVVKFAEKMKKPVYVKETGLSDLQKVSSLKPNHPCKVYVDSRRIPTTFHHELFYAPKFKEWTNTMYPGKFEPIKYEESRLVIPFLDRNKHLFGYQGRSLIESDKTVKYITIMLDADSPRVYGLNRVDFNRRYYCLEGPIDTMFLDNSIASCGSDIVSEVERLRSNKENAVIVYDNEPRNKDTVKKIAKAIRKGWKVVIWPTSADFKEDINDLYKQGYIVDEVVKQNIYSGLEAELRLNQWKRV